MMGVGMGALGCSAFGGRRGSMGLGLYGRRRMKRPPLHMAGLRRGTGGMRGEVGYPVGDGYEDDYPEDFDEFEGGYDSFDPYGYESEYDDDDDEDYYPLGMCGSQRRFGSRGMDFYDDYEY
jgi:hypothetical protein